MQVGCSTDELPRNTHFGTSTGLEAANKLIKVLWMCGHGLGRSRIFLVSVATVCPIGLHLRPKRWVGRRI